jgi:hypothetical protein
MFAFISSHFFKLNTFRFEGINKLYTLLCKLNIIYHICIDRMIAQEIVYESIFDI